ncbi:RHS repeat-associated core domain-containing protein [Photobacterium minamisatsumaniensis]|uniref:RHS repeat-associated core domain-containing protein n=1 Tax=Photobacterium minamisatsumaniensis TaxID=2910233 RepID=UPI003D0E4A61
MDNLSRRQFLKSSSMTLGLSAAATSLPINAMMFDDTVDLIIDLTQYGFHGHRFESTVGVYHTGLGYRLYDPTQRRFMQYDHEMAPFEKGGINGYTYVLNDPVNQVDPDGRFNIGAFFKALVSVVIGIAVAVAAVVTGGAALVVGLGVVAGVAGAVSGALDMASASLDADHPAQKGLSIASATTGLISAIASGGKGAVSALGNGFKTVGKAAGAATKFTKVTGFASKNLGKQLSHASTYKLTGLTADVYGAIGSTVDLAGTIKDDSKLKLAATIIKFTSGMAKGGIKTKENLKKTTPMFGKGHYYIDPKKRVDVRVDWSKRSFSLSKDPKSIADKATDIKKDGADTPKSTAGFINATAKLSLISPESLKSDANNTMQRLMDYARNTQAGTSAQWGGENIVGAA